MSKWWPRERGGSGAFDGGDEVLGPGDPLGYPHLAPHIRSVNPSPAIIVFAASEALRVLKTLLKEVEILKVVKALSPPSPTNPMTQSFRSVLRIGSAAFIGGDEVLGPGDPREGERERERERGREGGREGGMETWREREKERKRDRGIERDREIEREREKERERERAKDKSAQEKGRPLWATTSF